MGLKELYNSFTENGENLRQRIMKNPLRPYLNYATYLVTAQGPKLSYVNSFEPEYTRKTVKYNAPIVFGMFFVTALAAEYVRMRKNCNQTKA